MKGAERRRFKADLLAIAAAAEEGPEAASPAEEDGPPLSGKERRRQKAGAPLNMLAPLLVLSVGCDFIKANQLGFFHSFLQAALQSHTLYSKVRRYSIVCAYGKCNSRP